MISLGLLKSSALSVEMFKFTLYNTAMTVAYFDFVEITFLDEGTNALFFPYYAPFKWLTVHSCSFYLR